MPARLLRRRSRRRPVRHRGRDRPAAHVQRDRPATTSRSPSCLAATDPANPYGAALPWPRDAERRATGPGARPGALVVLVDGELTIYVERGGRTLLTWSEDADRLGPAAEALAEAARRGSLGRMTVESADGDAAARLRLHAGARGAPGRRLPRHPARAATEELRVPEGDTVFRAARLLDRALTGQVLTATDFRVPQHATADLSGGTVRRHRLPRQAPAHPGRPRPPDDAGRCTPTSRWRAPGGCSSPASAGRGPPTRRGSSSPPTDKVAVGFSLGIVELLDRDAEETARRPPRPGPARPRLGRRRGRTPPAGRAGPPGPRRAARPAQPRRHRQHVRRRAVLRRRCAPADPGRRRWPTCAGWSCARTRCSTSTRSGRSSPRPATCASASGSGSTAATGRRAGAAAPRSRWRCRGPAGTGAGVVLVPVLPAVSLGLDLGQQPQTVDPHRLVVEGDDPERARALAREARDLDQRPSCVSVGRLRSIDLEHLAVEQHRHPAEAGPVCATRATLLTPLAFRVSTWSFGAGRAGRHRGRTPCP